MNYDKLPQIKNNNCQRESFIGMISDEEAEKMKKELALFKKRFNDSFIKRNKFLWAKKQT